MTQQLLDRIRQNEQDLFITSKIHPERLDGEVWMGNVTLDSYQKIGWASKRLGNKAYSRAGSIASNLRPVFVQASEIEAAP